MRKATFILLCAFLVSCASAADSSPTAPPGRCGDSIFDAREQSNPALCPQDAPAATATLAPTDVAAAPSGAAPSGAIYLTIVSHNEEPNNGRGDFLADRDFYLRNRALVITLAHALAERGVAYNFQSDWNFLQAVAAHDTGSLLDSTNGKNLVRWLFEDMGVEIDPHAHESIYSYADVAYLIEQLGVSSTAVVGGFIFTPPTDGTIGWSQFTMPLSGYMIAEASWRAEILWGAASRGHQPGQDDATSGVWRPYTPNYFYTHDPTQSLTYIGGCTRDEQGVLDLLAAIDSGAAPANGFYTASIFVPQGGLQSEDIAALTAFIDRLPVEAGGLPVRWATLTQIADLWETEYGKTAFQWDCGG
jgi:hypothetical protein